MPRARAIRPRPSGCGRRSRSPPGPSPRPRSPAFEADFLALRLLVLRFQLADVALQVVWLQVDGAHQILARRVPTAHSGGARGRRGRRTHRLHHLSDKAIGQHTTGLRYRSASRRPGWSGRPFPAPNPAPPPGCDTFCGRRLSRSGYSRSVRARCCPVRARRA